MLPRGDDGVAKGRAPPPEPPRPPTPYAAPSAGPSNSPSAEPSVGPKSGLAPASSGSPTEVSPVGICYVCYEGPADAVFLDCGHGGMCYACARRTCAQRRGVRILCPLCRAPVTQLVQLGTAVTTIGDRVVVDVRR